MSVTVRARWVLPIDRSPIRDGWVDVQDGRIHRVGQGAPPRTGEVRDLGEAALLPGLVNAHTHLELSWMAGRVPTVPNAVDCTVIPEPLMLIGVPEAGRPGPATSTVSPESPGDRNAKLLERNPLMLVPTRSMLNGSVPAAAAIACGVEAPAGTDTIDPAVVWKPVSRPV